MFYLSQCWSTVLVSYVNVLFSLVSDLLFRPIAVCLEILNFYFTKTAVIKPVNGHIAVY